MEPAEELARLHERVRACYDCALGDHRTRAVPGEGPIGARVFFVGEAPGWHEDQMGRPFVGPAGQFLEHLLGLARLQRSQVFITNVVKCRPPENREPLPGEIEACRKYLQKQMELIGPRVVSTLGRHSLAWFFPKDSISKVHGQARKRDGLVFFAMYHPAAALHQASLRHTLEEDIQKLPAVLEEADKIQPQREEPKQLGLL